MRAIHVPPRRILITGAGGYLGGLLVREMANDPRYLVTAIAGRERGLNPVHGMKAVQWLRADLSSASDRSMVAREGPFDAILDLAASLPTRGRPFEETLDANRRLAIGTAELATATAAIQLVYASTFGVYGRDDGECPESCAPSPTNLYALGKLFAEHYLDISTRPGVIVTRLRISAPYGPSMPKGSVIPTFLSRLRAQSPITLLGSGRRTQDFVFEDDVVRAMRCALEARYQGPLNITGGASVSMRALAETLCRVMDCDATEVIEFEGDDPQENLRATYPNVAALRNLGWCPRVELADGLAMMASRWPANL